MFAAIQPPVKLSLLSLTPKEGTSSWGLVKFLPWKGKEGRGQASHFGGKGRGQEHAAHFGEREGDQLVFWEGVSLSLSPYCIYTPPKSKSGGVWMLDKAVLTLLLGYP